MVLFSSASFCFSSVDAKSSWTCSMRMEIIMGMYTKFINLKKASCVELFLEYSSWIVFLSPAPWKLFLSDFLSQTCFLWAYLHPLINRNWNQNAFQLKLATMTCSLNQSACPRCSGGKQVLQAQWEHWDFLPEWYPKRVILFCISALYFLNSFLPGFR